MCVQEREREIEREQEIQRGKEKALEYIGCLEIFRCKYDPKIHVPFIGNGHQQNPVLLL